MNKISMFLVFVLLLTSCVDKSSSVRLCDEKGLQFYKTTVGCDTVCINIETGEKHTYEGNCRAVIEYNGD